MTYRLSLHDPRWESRRLTVLKRARFRCERPGCGSRISLQVHHRAEFFDPAKAPWAYAPHELECLCALCHAARHVSGQTPSPQKWLFPHRELLHLMVYPGKKVE